MPIVTKDLRRRLEDIADSIAFSTGKDSKDAKEKAKAKAGAKKKKRQEQRRLLDRDDRSLKKRLIDFAKGSDNYSRMGDINSKKGSKKGNK